MIGVIINTTGSNSAMISEIVSAYNSGTVVPDEIAINIYDITDTDTLGSFLSLREETPNVFLYANKMFESDAHFRKKSLTLTSADIILYQTDKVIPHKQRVEIVKHYFDNYDIVSLTHTTSYRPTQQIDMDYVKIILSNDLHKRYFPFGVREHATNYTRTYGTEFNIKADIENGCVRREVLNRIQWKDTFELTIHPENSYYEFCLDILYTYNKSIIINVPLIEIRK